VENGTVCDDGNPDTEADRCFDGTCTDDPCAVLDCAGIADACNTGTCNRELGRCEAMPVMDGAECDDGDPCTTGDQCGEGSCQGAAAMDGTVCDDGDECTTPDACDSGSCVGAPLDCSDRDGACVVGQCNPVTGTCGTTPKMNATVCNDGNACTTGDQCTGGVCGGAPRNCSTMDDMCNVGVCETGTGSCVRDPVDDGTACDDGDAMTTGDECTSGACAGT
jgi:hypothetical protein